MLAVVGNKVDNYEFEEIPDIEAKSLANQLNGLFHTTSAKTGLGIDELFKRIGNQIVNEDSTIMGQRTRKEISLYNKSIKLEKQKKEDKKKWKISFC